MSLPTLNTPTYELVIPSTKKKVKYRPFVVKEEKVLLMALESEDDVQIANAIKKYNVDHTGAKTQLGGLKLGKIICEYQGSLKVVVA